MTVQGPVKEQQRDGLSHRGAVLGILSESVSWTPPPPGWSGGRSLGVAGFVGSMAEVQGLLVVCCLFFLLLLPLLFRCSGGWAAHTECQALSHSAEGTARAVRAAACICPDACVAPQVTASLRFRHAGRCPIN